MPHLFNRYDDNEGKTYKYKIINYSIGLNEKYNH